MTTDTASCQDHILAPVTGSRHMCCDADPCGALSATDVQMKLFDSTASELDLAVICQGRRLQVGDEGDMSPQYSDRGDYMLYVLPKLTSQCMPFSSLTSFHSIQLQK